MNLQLDEWSFTNLHFIILALGIWNEVLEVTIVNDWLGIDFLALALIQAVFHVCDRFWVRENRHPKS